MKVVLLCGGTGKRMFPIGEDKFLLDFLGKPLLQHQIEMAQEAEIDRFVIIGNLANIGQIKEVTQRVSGAEFEFALQQKPLGIADALKSATPFLNEQIVVVNPNDIFSISGYKQIIREAGQATSLMLGYRVKDYFPGGYLEVDTGGNLKHIVEKPKPGEEPSDLVNILVHLHREPKRLLEYIDTVETARDDVYESALDNMVRDGYKIRVIPHHDSWAPIKYPWHILKAMKYFLDRAESHISCTAHISEKATIEGKVILCDNVRVLENAVIRGPAYAGPNTVIGNNALVRDYSHIGANSVIGYSTEIKHSYIGNNCWFHANYIGDSIIADDCSFGSGAVTANFRLDEKGIFIRIGSTKIDTGSDKLGAIVGQGCRIGINASLMPGVRIGANSFVGPGVCLNRDLQANQMIIVKQQYQTLESIAKLTQRKRQEQLDKLMK